MYYIWRVVSPNKKGYDTLDKATKAAQKIMTDEKREGVVIVEAVKKVQKVKPLVQIEVLPFE